MIIKSINKTFGYKGLPDEFHINFDENITYIVGDNFKTKSTILSVPLWVLTGYNMSGGNQEDVSDDKRNIRNVIAEITIIDNDGELHTISRSKGKNNLVLVDGIRATKDTLTKFYKDIQFFLCAYNPYRFNSLEDAKQKELLLRLLPGISNLEAFNLLNENEREKIGAPIADNKEYTKNKRADIKNLKFEISRLEGIVESCLKTTIIQEGELQTFEKDQYLNEIKDRYDNLLMDSSDMINIEDLTRKINRLKDRINQNIKVDLENAKKEKAILKENINNVSSITSKCPTCKQEIKSETMQQALKKQYDKQLENLTNKILNLKEETKGLIKELKEKEEIFNKLNTSENLEIANKRKELKDEIDSLSKQKHEIDLHNQEVLSIKRAINDAKEEIKKANTKIEEYEDKITLYEEQIKISNKLKAMIINRQLQLAENSLKDVKINFIKIDEVTEDIEDDYYITYKGRLYKKLSQSEKMRADFEIANFINKQSGINTPMFIDDSERIRDIALCDDNQTIVAIYIKYSELNILYDYNDVLRVKKESIEKQLNNDTEFVLLDAA